MLDDFVLYGLGVKTNNEKIIKDAPNWVKKMEKEYGSIDYGMITYDENREQCQKYYCLFRKEYPRMEMIKLPASKWLKFRIPNQKAADIQKTSLQFYQEFLPSCKYNLKELPELEYYHDGVTDFLVAIY